MNRSVTTRTIVLLALATATSFCARQKKSSRSSAASAAPALLSLTSADGDFTKSQEIRLALQVQTAEEVYIASEHGCPEGGTWHPIAEEIPWTLPKKNQENHISAKVRQFTLESNCINLTVTHDDEPPTAPDMSLASEDDDSASIAISSEGAAEIQKGKACDALGDWEPVADKFDFPKEGSDNQSIAVRIRDQAGNVTDCHVFNYTPASAAADGEDDSQSQDDASDDGSDDDSSDDDGSDDSQSGDDDGSDDDGSDDGTVTPPVVPSGGMMLSEQALTNEDTVTLTLTHQDTVAARVYQTADCTGSHTEHDPDDTIVITLAQNVLNHVGVILAGTEANSSCMTQSVTHDNLVPSAPPSLSYLDEAASLVDSPVISWGAATDASGITGYQVAIGTTFNSTDVTGGFMDVGDVLSATITVAGGYEAFAENGTSYYVTVRAVDAAGNVGTANASANDFEGLVCQGSALSGTPFAEGSPLVGNTHTICTAAQLANIADPLTHGHNMQDTFVLEADIDLSSYVYGVNPFPLIGDLVNPFAGVFDGNGHKISNLTRGDLIAPEGGLFGTVSGSITDLHIENFSITATGDTGGLVAIWERSSGAAVISDITLTGVTVVGDSNCGGLVGRANHFGIISGDLFAIQNVTGDVDVSCGFSSVGGLVGEINASEVEISDSHITGSLQGRSGSLATYVGGLAGAINPFGPGDIILDANSFQGSLDGMFVMGGLVGQTGGSELEVEANWVDVTMSGDYSVGGLIGNLESSGQITVADNAVFGTLNTLDPFIPTSGGLFDFARPCPDSHVVENNLVAASFTSTDLSQSGAFRAVEDNLSCGGTLTYSNNLYDADVLPAAVNKFGGTGATTLDLGNQVTYPGSFDFDNIWEMNGNGYPTPSL